MVTYNVRNVMEVLVDALLDDCIKKAEACNCARCRADIQAYALNHLPPQYAVTVSGSAIVRANNGATQSQVDIISAIMVGVTIVGKNPHHEAE